MFPRTGEAIAMRVADGHELVVRVRQADRPRIIVVPALDAPTNEGIEAAFVAGVGAEGLQGGDQLQLTLTDADGLPVVSDLDATVVHVAAGVAGIAFAQPFD